MGISRYARAPVMGMGRFVGTSNAIVEIRQGIADGSIRYTERTLRGGERLDTVAGQVYDDGSYWWVIAAASHIGWGLQVPPGTYLRLPNLEDVLAAVG